MFAASGGVSNKGVFATMSSIPHKSSRKQSGIYIIRNNKNGKVYVGQAIDFRGRWMDHKSRLKNNAHHNQHLQHAWNKYGEKSFSFHRLEYCSVEQLNEREQHHIGIYKTRNMCYNMTDGGDGTRGRIVKDETRRKISISKKGANNPNFGIPHSAEHRRKISESLKGNTYMLGKFHSAETREKMSKQRKGANNPNFGKVFSPEYRQKLSDSHSNPCTWNGIAFSNISQCAKYFGIPKATMRRWIVKGYTCDKDIKRKRNQK